MTNQKSLSPVSNELSNPRTGNAKSIIPISKMFEQNYVVYRIKLNSLEITKETRDDILMSLSQNKKFIQIGDLTVMLNSITSIEPMHKIDKKGYIQVIKWEQERQDKYRNVEKSFKKETILD